MRKTYCPKQVKNSINLVILLSVFALIFQSLLGASFAATKDTINFQGKIVRNDTGYEGLNVVAGAPACVVSGASNDTCDFRVRYYDASSGGTLFFGESFPNVEIGEYNGAFNLELGGSSFPINGVYTSLEDVIKNEDDIYVELMFAPLGNAVYSETFSRMPMQSTAFAIRSKYASESETAFQFDSAADDTGYTASAGMVYYDSDENVLKMYNGSSWTELTTGSGGSSLFTDGGDSTYLTSLTDHLLLGASSYTAIGSSTYSSYIDTNIGSMPPFAFDMGAERLTLSGSQQRSGLTVYSDYASSSPWPLVSFKAENSGFSNTILELIQDGTGDLLSMMKGSTEVLKVDNNGALYFHNYTSFSGTTDDRLYNVNGSLYWDGTELGSGSSLWTDGGTYSYLTSTTDDVVIGGDTAGTAKFFFDVSEGNFGIGTSTPGSKLEIAGASSVITNTTGDITITADDTTVIKANDTEADNLMEWQDSSSTVLGLINQNGYATFGSSTSNTGAMLTLGANTSSVAQLNLTSSSGVDVTAPTSGDLWWNGTNLYFYDGADNVDLLTGGGGDLYSEHGSVSDEGYLNVAHSDNTYEVLADGWICVGGSNNATCSGGNWKNINESSITVGHNLSNQWNDADEDGIIRSDVRLTDVELAPAIDIGTGADGDITVSSNTSINSTSLITGRTCADGGDAVNYSVTSLTSTTATLSSIPSAGCLSEGDEILLINLKGISSAYENIGNYESLEIGDISGSTITFTKAKLKYYGNNTSDDTNIGTGSGNQRVMLQRIPNYNNVTVNSGVNFYPDDWNGTKGGVLFFRANGTVSVSGTIHASGDGFGGGSAQSSAAQGGYAGEGFAGSGGNGGNYYNAGASGSSGGGGGGSADRRYPRTFSGGSGSSIGGGGGGGGVGMTYNGNTNYGGGGGGGGYGSGGGYGQGQNNGTSGGSSSGNGGSGSTSTDSRGGGGGGGGTYGEASLDKMFLGSGGASGGASAYEDMTTATSGYGGDGGGIVYISANVLTNSGAIRSNGSSGSNGSSNGAVHSGSGGGGAGGSVKLMGISLTLGSSTVTASGGSYGTNNYDGGSGGTGRIAVYYVDSISGSTSPTASVTSTGYNTYGIYTSPAIPTPNAQTYGRIQWSEELDTYGKISVQTRTGSSTNSTDGTWEEWRPFTTTTNYINLETADTHTNWSGTNMTVAEGDVTRNINFFEDDDESTAGNITKLTSSTNGGYAEATISSSDLSNYDYITAWVRASQVGTTLRLGFGETAATEQTEEIVIDTADVWQKVYWDLSDIGDSSRNGVTKLRLTNLSGSSNTIYLDNVRAELLLSDNEGSVITSTPDDYIQYRTVFTTTNASYRPMLENISFTYNAGYRIVLYDEDNVRLYNYSGETQYLKLDVATTNSSSSGDGFTNGVATSDVSNGEDAVAFTFNTSETFEHPTSKLLSVMNNSVEKMYLDADGNLYVSGSVMADKGLVVGLTNNSGGTVAEKSLVILDDSANNSFTTTTAENIIAAYGVVQGTDVNGDVDKDGNCDNGDTCLVAFEGLVDVKLDNAGTASRGDFVYSSTTAGSGHADGNLDGNGMVGVIASIENAGSGYVGMVFNAQNKVAADMYLNVGFDKNAYRDIYQVLASDYNAMSEAERRGLLEEGLSQSVMFDNFVDGLKIDSSSSSITLDHMDNRMGLWGGDTINSTALDIDSNRYLGSSTATLEASYYYDRSQTGEQGQDSSPDVLSDIGVDPNWYNGVSLQTECKTNCLANSNLSPDYNGSLFKVTGTYGVSSEHGSVDIKIVDNMVTGIKADISSSDGTCSVSSATLNFGSEYSFTAGSCSGSSIKIKPLRADYNSGDTFRVASWLLEPETANDRGTKREFPEHALILGSRDASEIYLTIVDTDTQRVWMKFASDSAGYSTGNMLVDNSVHAMGNSYMMNGILYVSVDHGVEGNAGAFEIDFVDDGAKAFSGGSWEYQDVIGERNGAGSYVSVNTDTGLISTRVNDVHANVVPNQVTQEVTVSGWGYIEGNGTGLVTESVSLPYEFNNVPIVTANRAGAAGTSIPSALSDCYSAGSAGYSQENGAVNISETEFTLSMVLSAGTFASGNYYCYTWEATGTVSPRTYSAWATEGGTTVVNEAANSNIDIDHAQYTDSNNWNDIDVWLTSNGDLYKVVNDPLDGSANELHIFYSVNTSPSDNSLATRDSTVGENNFIPNAVLMQSLYIEEDRSSLSMPNNTLYIGTEDGVYSVKEDRLLGNQNESLNLQSSISKLYTKDYISESMIGDTRGMWPLNYDNTSSDNEDVSVNSNNLTATNITSADALSGVRGTAVDFDGSTEYLYDADNTTYDRGTNFSVGAWFNSDTVSGTHTIIGKYNAGVSGDFSLRTSNDEFYFTGGSGSVTTSSANLSENTWYYVVVAYDNGSASIYLNGALLGSGSTTSVNGSGNLGIGCDWSSSSATNLFDGTIDEVFLVEETLSSSQIKEMYDTGRRALDGSHSVDDSYNTLNGTSNDVRSIMVTPDGRYMYVGTEGGGVSKIDLMSDTLVDSYTTSTVPVLASNNAELLSGRYYPVFAGDIGSNGKIMSMDAYSNGSTGTYYSETVTFDSNSNKAYLWMHAYIDPDDSSAGITVSASNDGGSTYVEGTLIKTNTNGDLPEYEYSFDFTSSDKDYKVKMVITRAAGVNSATYIKDWALAQMDVNSGTGNGLYSEEGTSVASGSYLDVVHGQGTYDLIAKGWVYNTDTSRWVEVDNTDSTVIGSVSDDWTDGSTIRSTINTSDVQLTNSAGYYYGAYTSDEIPTPDAQAYGNIFWNQDLDTNGAISVQTRTGSTTDSTDGTWEAWTSLTDGTSSTTLIDSDTHTDWSDINATAADGDVTRNIDYFEDEDESTVGNTTQMTTSTNGGYLEATISSTDLSGYDYITAWVRNNQTGASLSLGIGESAATEQTETVTIDSANTWQKVYWDISDITGTSRDAVTKIRLTNLSATSTSVTAYIDNVQAEKVITDNGGSKINSTADDYLQYRIIFTTTNTDNQPELESIGFVYETGYTIEMVDSNTVRLYNNTGETKRLRLDVILGGAMIDLQSNTTGGVLLAPSLAQVDSENSTNSIWINKTGTGGNLLKLQTMGTDMFVVDSSGNLSMGGDIEVTGGEINLGSSGDQGSIRYNETDDVLEFTNDGTTWIAMGGASSLVSISAEYPGATLVADGTSNTGTMTSDAEGTSANSMNYYEWNSSEVSLNDYDVRVRFTLPSDFDSWGSGGITLNYATESASSSSSQVDFYVYEETSATVDASSEDLASSVAGTWTTSTISGTSLTDCNAAGEVCVLILRMSSASDNYVRVGDIEFNYNRTL